MTLESSKIIHKKRVNSRQKPLENITIMMIPSGGRRSYEIRVPSWTFRYWFSFALIFSSVMGYVVFDYINLCGIRKTYQAVLTENEGLKGEAKALMTTLDDVKSSLRKVKDFSSKLTEITQARVKDISKTTGVSSFAAEGGSKITSQEEARTQNRNTYLPPGLDPDRLFFRPAFDQLNSINSQSMRQAVELQHILSNLSKQNNLLSSVPTVTPVNGWVTSAFGYRNSPFGGERVLHRGMDIASPTGTAIYSPADGIVLYAGTQQGFGNFVAIAHGYGIVSRYGHNAQNMVRVGQRVERGEQIAAVGDSGRSTGPHLHYEVHVNGAPVNPSKFILDMSEPTVSAH